MTDYAIVYGQFFVDQEPITGVVYFDPRDRFVLYGGNVVYLRRIEAEIVDGILVHEGQEGIAIPASPFGVFWNVKVHPRGYQNVIQSYSGDTISLGD